MIYMSDEQLKYIKTAISNINAIIKSDEFDIDFKFDLILIALKRIDDSIRL